MPANEQTVRMVNAALGADAGMTESEVHIVLNALRGSACTTLNTPSPDELLDEKAVQALLKLSHQTLWRLEKDGELVAHRIGRSRRYSRRQIEGYISGLSRNGVGCPAADVGRNVQGVLK